MYRLICHRARLAKQAGKRRYSIRTIWENLRWTLDMGLGGEGYKLNDHYPPFYARLIDKQEGDLKDFFEVRGR